MNSKKRNLVTISAAIAVLGSLALIRSQDLSQTGRTQVRRDTALTKVQQSRYRVSTVLELEYGPGPDEVGLIRDIEDVKTQGPRSFAVTGQTIYILDSVNQRVKAFDQYGVAHRSIPVSSGADIAVDSAGDVFVLDNASGAIVEYRGSKAVSRQALSQPAETIRIDPAGNIDAVIKGVDGPDYTYTLEKSTKAIRSMPIVTTYSVIKTGDHSGAVVNTVTGQRFEVVTEEAFGSIAFLGQDRQNNLYVVIEQLLPGNTVTVKAEVRKYTPIGLLLASVPLAVDGIAPPDKDVILGSDGSIYNLRVLQDRMIVQKWTPQN